MSDVSPNVAQTLHTAFGLGPVQDTGHGISDLCFLGTLFHGLRRVCIGICILHKPQFCQC